MEERSEPFLEETQEVLEDVKKVEPEELQEEELEDVAGGLSNAPEQEERSEPFLKVAVKVWVGG